MRFGSEEPDGASHSRNSTSGSPLGTTLYTTHLFSSERIYHNTPSTCSMQQAGISPVLMARGQHGARI